jgi:hypothetical protein
MAAAGLHFADSELAGFVVNETGSVPSGAGFRQGF